MLCIIILAVTGNSYAEYKANRIEDLQKVVERLQTKIIDFKEIRLIDDLEFDVIIYNLQRNLIGVNAALAEIKLVPEVEVEEVEDVSGETAE